MYELCEGDAVSNYDTFSPTLEESPSYWQKCQSDFDDESRIENDDRKNVSYEQHEHRLADDRQEHLVDQRHNDQRQYSHIDERIKSQDSLLSRQLKRPGEGRQEFAVWCFTDERIVVLLREDINMIIGRPNLASYEHVEQTCDCLIEHLVLSYCANWLGFRPHQVKRQTFVLTASTKEGELVLNGMPLSCLESVEDLEMKRVKRRKCRPEAVSGDGETICIIGVDRWEVRELMDRNKSGADVKERVATLCQLIGKVIIVTYASFRLIDLKKKIADQPEKVFEVYQESGSHYKDRVFAKRNSRQAQKSQAVCIRDSQKPHFEEVQVNQHFFHGRLSLKIEQTSMTERWSGGLMGRLRKDRLAVRSILTLVSLRVASRLLTLEHLYKDRRETVSYQFQEDETMQRLLKHLLMLGRRFNINFTPPQ